MTVLESLQSRHQTVTYKEQAVSKKHIKYLTQCLKHIPSKNNEYQYDILIMEDLDQKLGKWLLYNHTWCSTDLSTGKIHVCDMKPGYARRTTNNQYTAPLKIMFIGESTGFNNHIDNIEIGMSAQALILACEELGLGVALGRCLEKHSQQKVLNKFSKVYQSRFKKPIIKLTICIGHAEDNFMLDKDNIPNSAEKIYETQILRNGKFFGMDRKNIPQSDSKIQGKDGQVYEWKERFRKSSRARDRIKMIDIEGISYE